MTSRSTRTRDAFRALWQSGDLSQLDPREAAARVRAMIDSGLSEATVARTVGWHISQVRETVAERRTGPGNAP